MPRRGNGEGSITQRPNGLWQASLRVDGSRKYVYGATRSEVAKKLNDLRNTADRGELVNSNQTTVSAYLDEWLSTVRPSLKPKTAAGYGDSIRIHIKPAIGSIKLQTLRPLDVQKLYSEIGSRRSPNTVKNIAICLHKALADAKKWKLIPVNPADGAILPKPKTDDHVIWDRDASLRFVRSCQDSPSPYDPLWLFLLGSGCRIGEALGLRWADVDLDAGSVRIVRAISFVHGKALEADTPKTRAGIRTISLPDFAISALRRLRESASGDGAVFATKSGTVPSQTNLRRSFHLSAGRASVPPLRIHDLRHCHATLAIYAGVDPKTLQKRLGHATLQMTLNLYAHAVQGADREAASRLGSLLT